MSCYFHHLKGIFEEAGVEVTPGNRKRIDQAIRRLVGTADQHCPETWKQLKTQVLADDNKRHEFAARLRDAIS